MRVVGAAAIRWLILYLTAAGHALAAHDGPVVGVLAQELSAGLQHLIGRPHVTYVAASYVKAVEASGGRVVPVFTNRSTEYYANIVEKVNGILIPGGGSAFNVSFGISQSTLQTFRIAKIIKEHIKNICKIYIHRCSQELYGSLYNNYRQTIETQRKSLQDINNLNDHFPMLGICLGFELLLIASINGKYPLIKCNAQNMNLPLNLIPNMAKKSVLFKKMPKNIQTTLLEEPVTANHHVKCITNKNFTSMHLDKFWNAITTNEDKNNLTFISTIEAKNYPFVGLQFHPEKNAYEWRKDDPHSWSAIYSARYFYDWFINECRKNKHRYSNQTELENQLIYNYPKTYTGKLNSVFEEVYLFDE